MRRNSSLHNELFLQPSLEQRYVRSFLFSRRVHAPFAHVHLLARTMLVLCLSGVQLRAIDTVHPDPAGAAVFWGISLLLFIFSGMHARVARLYFLLTLPSLLSLFTTWLLFNPVPGKVVLLAFPLYSGRLALGVALWEVVWIALVGAYFLWRRKLALGVLIATLAALALSHLLELPSWTFARVAVFHPLTIMVSDRGLLVAITKVIGYSGMVLSTMALVVTSRDVELIGALRQLRLPQPLIFFLSTVFRSLDLALSDYETIRQAHRARAIDARPRSFLRRLRDLGSLAVPMIAMMIRRSSEIGDALIARGYTLSRQSADYFETSPWRLLDWGVATLSLGLLYLAIGPRLDLTALIQRW